MLLQLMGGKVWLESEGLGKGTTCKMLITLGIYHDLKQAPAKEALSSPSTLKNLKGLEVNCIIQLTT
jgi:hypothetical protein